MKRSISVLLSAVLALSLLAGCSQSQTAEGGEEAPVVEYEGTLISLSDDGITVDGEAAPTDDTAAVYTANDIVYYEDGHDFTYGAGSESDAHSADEAAAHTVVHISQPGTYILTGQLSAGQVAVDLGKGAKSDPSAVVTLVLDNVDITCTVAPAVIFYKVYECDTAFVDFDDNDTETYEATKDVDTSAAGANVIIADDSVNTVNGSYVAKIYKPESVELNADGTEVDSAKKLHKYDGAFYSKMSMNVTGGEAGTGSLCINAENEGLDSELHLTVNGGNIVINAGNDGINTNEDNVSVTTVNGGTLVVNVTGETGEGDGIDSNGWLVINGGTVMSYACSSSMDSGLDSDMGIYLNGGTVVATGNMYDRIDGGDQSYAVFSFSQRQSGGTAFTLKNADGAAVLDMEPVNDFQYLVISTPELTEGDYTLWQGTTQFAGSDGGDFGGPGMGGMIPFDHMEPPEGMEFPKKFEMGELPEGLEPPEGFDDQMPEMPEGFDPGQRPGGQGGEKPDGQPGEDGQEPPERPEGELPGQGGGRWNEAERSETFHIVSGGSQFSSVAPVES